MLMRKGRLAVAGAVFFLALLPSFASAWSGLVVGVSDGDTITVMHGRHGERVRLYGVDCPEKGQPYSAVAKRATSALVFGKVAEVTPKDVDRYGRTVALVAVAGVSVNEALVREGYAWVYTHYCREARCAEWLAIEREAREARRGLWAGKNPVPPWEWRKGRGR